MYWLEITLGALISFLIAASVFSQSADKLIIALFISMFITLWPLWTVTFMAYRHDSEISPQKRENDS